MERISGWLITAGLACGLLASLTGCKPSDAVRQAKVIGNGTRTEQRPVQPEGAPLDPATLGTVSGTVHFTGKPPERVKIDMSMDPVCSMTGGENYAEQYVVHEGKLANVYVYVKSGPAAAMSAGMRNAEPLVMDQVGCRYTPHVIALMRGGTVEFRNSDATMHNIHTMPVEVGNAAIDVSQGPKGAPQQKQFQKPEVMLPVRCNNHPWMNAFINISATPFFAVTDVNGHFEIRGLPAGTYTLAAVHEKMGEQTMTVTVAPKETENEDFTYSVK